jgi:PAS domain-containing protein/DNA-binding CsgD family transcriptional regulator
VKRSEAPAQDSCTREETEPEGTELTSPSALIDLIYEAAVDPTRWKDFVRALSRSCGGAAAAISLRIPIAGAPIHAARVGLLDKYAPLFPRHLQLGLPWGSLLLPIYTRGFAFGSAVLANEEVSETDYYREYMEPQGLAAEGPLAHTFAQADGSPVAAVVLYRRIETRPVDRDDLERCNVLVPHLKRAYRIHCEMHGERERRRALAEVVDRFPMGVLLLDAQQHCVMVSRSAERIFERCDGLRLDRGRPVAELRHEHEELKRGLAATAEASATGIPGPTRSVSITRPSGARDFSLLITPLLGVSGDSPERDAVSAVFINDPEAGELRTEVLQELYGFTTSEARVVAQLVITTSVEDAARACGIQTNTARGYLKIAYQKTGTHSQRDLLRLILTGVGPIREL